MWILTKLAGLATIGIGVLVIGSTIFANAHHKLSGEKHEHSSYTHSDASHSEEYYSDASYMVSDDDNIVRSFDVKEGGTLTVDTDLGAIEVVADQSNRVEITIKREFKNESARETMEQLEFSFDQDGNSVKLVGDWKGEKKRWRNMKRSGWKIQIVAHVPSNYNVDALTSGGSISVSDLNGTVDVKTSGGSLKLGDIQGTVNGKTSGGSITLEGGGGTAQLETSGGSITLGEVNGEVEAHTSGGSIRIDRAKGSVDASTSGGSVVVNEVMGTINATTSGGSITATITQQPKEDCRLTTSGGSVNVKLSPDVQFDLDAKTSSGSRLRTDFVVQSSGTVKKNEVQGSVNGGGPLLYLRTSGGGINVNQI